MGPFGRLKIVSGVRAGAEWDLSEEGSFPIGSNPKARFHLEDPKVEPVHAGLHCGPEGAFVDNRSKVSPVKVNGDILMGRHKLQAGDLLLVGSVTLEYEAPSGRSASRSAKRQVPGPPPRQEGNSFQPVSYSGRAPLEGVLAGLGAGIAGGLPLAFAYAYLDLFNPCINVITILFTAVFGALTGLAAGIGMRWGKVRCRRTQGIIGGVVGAVALHLSWVVWVSAFLESQHRLYSQHPVTISSLYVHPGDLLYEMGRICDFGAWSLFGSVTPSGIVLGLIWLVEAAIILAAAWFAARSFTPALFCEGCATWGVTRKAVLAVEALDPASVKARLEDGDLSFLAEHPVPGSRVASLIQVDLASCTGCGDTRTLTLSTATMTVGEAKQEKVDLKALAEDLLITRQEAEWIESLSTQAGESGSGPTPKPTRFSWKK